MIMGRIFLHRYGTICLVFAVTFCLGLAYYGVAHPAVPYDCDDWKNLSQERRPVPLWRSWNPIKVLPEETELLCGYFGAYIATPLVGDYLHGIVLTTAVFFSLILATYMSLFCWTMQEYRKLPAWQATLITCIFGTFHFLALKGLPFGSQPLLSAITFNCMYHYVLPAVVNMMLVVWLMAHPHLRTFTFDQCNAGKQTLLLMAIYLAIFSSILHSIILAAYVGSVLLSEIDKRDYASLDRLKEFLKAKALYAGILVTWLISLFLESIGGNARRVVSAQGGEWPLLKATEILGGTFLQMNRYFLMWGIALTLAGIYCWWRNRRTISTNEWVRYSEETLLMHRRLRILIMSFVLTVAFLWLVGARANPSDHLGRGEVLVSAIFFLIMLQVEGMLAISRRWPKLCLALPILAVYMFTMTISREFFYKDASSGVTAQTAMNVSRDLISQFQAAETAGANSIELHVPDHNSEGNWPHPEGLGREMMCTLYAHGVMSRHLDIKGVVFDPAINERYHLKASLHGKKYE